MRKTGAILICMVLTSGTFLGAAEKSDIGTVKMSILLKRAKKNDRKALLELGRRGNKSAIPLLKKVQKKKKKRGQTAPYCQMALAKLGDESAFQEILQELRGEGPGSRGRAIKKLKYVGGNRAIVALANLLHEKQWRTRSKKSKVPGDAKAKAGQTMMTPLAYSAINALIELVPDPPTGPVNWATEVEKEVEGKTLAVDEWLSWWKKNKAKFVNDEPQEDEAQPKGAE
ncbi:HEAT repeat domain-containing protein [Elusimicrobiota bacterium]